MMVLKCACESVKVEAKYIWTVFLADWTFGAALTARTEMIDKSW